MSILMGLFGRSKDRKRPAVDRCIDCGMMEGKQARQESATGVDPLDNGRLQGSPGREPMYPR